MESFLVLPKWTLKSKLSLRASILSGFSKDFYGQVVDAPPFAAAVQKPNQELELVQQSSVCLHPSWLLDFPVSFEEWWEAFILFWSQDQTLFLDSKPGIMTKPLTLWVAYHFSKHLFSEGPANPSEPTSESSVHRCFLQRNEVHSRSQMGNPLYFPSSMNKRVFPGVANSCHSTQTSSF